MTHTFDLSIEDKNSEEHLDVLNVERRLSDTTLA